MQVQELVRRYLAHVEKRGTYSTVESFAERKSTLDRFAVRFGERDVESLAPADLTDWIEDQPGWRSTSTCRSKANQINRMMNWAAREKRIPANPFIGHDPFPEAERRPCLDDDALANLCGATDVRFAQALRFLRGCGCRFGDMSKLSWPMILWDQGIAVLGEHKTRKSTGRAKIIPIPDHILKMLSEMKALNPAPDALVFRNRDGRQWTRRAFGAKLRRLKRKLGLTGKQIGSTHGIRHQWGTVCYLETGDIKLVSLGLGHKSVAITERFYVHVDGDIGLLRKAAEAANRR